MHIAASADGHTLLPILFEHNIHLSARDDNGMTALHVAACGDNIHFLKSYRRRKYPHEVVNEKNKSVATLLHTKLRCDAIRTVEWLLTLKQVNFTEVDNDRNNNFHCTVSYRASNLYRKYRPFGPSTLFREDKNKTRGYRSFNFDPHIDCLLQVACHNRIFSRGGLVNGKNINGQSPLHIASLNGFEDALNISLKFDADSNVTDNTLKLHIHYATEKRSTSPIFKEPLHFIEYEVINSLCFLLLTIHNWILAAV